MSEITFSCFLCPSPCACDHNELSPICVDVLITRLIVRLMFTVRFLYPRISFLPLSAINTLFHYICRNKFRVQKTHTKRTADAIFVFCLVWLFELTFFSNKSCQNRQVPVCKGDNPNIKYESFEPMCIRTLFSRPAHSNSLVMELLLICLYSKLADFLGTLLLILTEI